ncbi:MAG: hypothetical protein GY938_17235 [Ketobacter sp.]|nr:hypothetical protein [Ketobacter sp.]
MRYCCPEIRKVCDGKWTQWFDRDNPSGSGDWEQLIVLRKEHDICLNVTNVEVRTRYTDVPAELTGQFFFQYDLDGFVCRNADNTGECLDYKVRFCCPLKKVCEGTWTQFFDRDNPGGTGDWETLLEIQKQYKVCKDPTMSEAYTLDGVPAELTGQVIFKNDAGGFACRNEDQPKGVFCLDYKVRFCCPDPLIFCDGEWTDWMDRDNPSGTGDWELLSDFINEGYDVCPKPTQIEVRALDNTPAMNTGDTFWKFDLGGFACRNQDNKKPCCDYKVRFCCPRKKECKKGHWVGWFDRDNPSGTGDWELTDLILLANGEKMCKNPTEIQARVKGSNVLAEDTGQNFLMYNLQGFVCRNQDNNGLCLDYEVQFCCPCDCEGEILDQKICGQDQIYYSSHCEMKCAGIREAEAKVCDVDGKTYANICELMAAGAVYDPTYRCCKCNPQDTEVCASDGQFYTSSCAIKCAELTQADDC